MERTVSKTVLTGKAFRNGSKGLDRARLVELTTTNPTVLSSDMTSFAVENPLNELL